MSDENSPHEIRTPESLPNDLMLLAHIDPLGGERAEEVWHDSAASTALLESVMAESGGPTTKARARRRKVRWIGAVAAAAVAAVVVVVAPWGSSPAYAIRHLPDGVIEVDWVKDLRNGDDIARELRSFGIDVDVVVSPVSPSMVGQVVSTALPGREPGPVDGITWGDDGSEDVFTWQIDPYVFEGPLRIELGVEAKVGEPYTVAGEVFEPGEVLGGLHCVLGEPLRADRVAPYLDRLGLTAEWDVVSAVPGRTDAFQEKTVEAVPNGEVLWGYAVDSGTIRFSVRPDGVDPSGIDGPEPRLSDVPCTPEMSTGW